MNCITKPILHFARSLFLIALLLTSVSSFATHVVGVDLSYSWVSGNTYKITLVAYGDCAGASFPSLPLSSPLICIYDGNVSKGSLNLTLQPPTAGVEITPVCPADASKTQCTNISFTIPGIKKFVYSGNYTLPYASSVWRFLFTGNMGGSGGSAGRGSTITNISSPGTSIIQLVDTLNNIAAPNNSPALTVLPTPFFCLNQLDNYNPGATDIDADSLAFALVSAYDGTTNCAALGTPVSYISPYTPAAPLATSSFLFDPKTGQITFIPNILQRSLVVYNVREFRGGTLVGTCQREMTFLVLTCTSVAPWGVYTTATTGTVIDSTNYSVCDNAGAFAVTMVAKEVDTSNNINVTASGLPPGVTFTTVNNNTNHPVSTISGNTSSLSPGTYVYYVTFKDNACPLNGVRTIAYTIIVLPVPVVTAGPDVTMCAGLSTTLSATGGVSYRWSSGSGLSCTLCPGPVASPSATTVYTVTGTASNGCSNWDSVRVTILPLPVLVAGTPASICVGASTPLSVSGAATYAWSPSTGLSCTTCTNPTATPTSTITYSVTGTGSNGCVSTASVTITVNPLPSVTVAPAAICSGISATLFPSGAISYTWSPGSGLSCTACTNPITTVTTTTTYTVTGTDVNGCKDTASVTVIISPTPPPPLVVTPVTYCQNATATALTATGTSLLWYISAIGGTGSSFAPVPSTSTVGSVKWYISQTVGGCESNRDSITVVINPLPTIAILPTNPEICIGGDTAITASGGVSYAWAPPTGLSSTTAASVRANPVSTTTYTVTGTSSLGCINTASITVVVHPLPTVTVTPSTTTICAGSTTTLTASGAVSYVWSPASSLSSSISAMVTASPTVTATYTVTGTDAFTCVNTATATVIVNPIPPPPLVVTPITYCQNATAVALTATGSSLLWYTAVTGGVGSATAPVPSTATVGATKWYVSQTVGGCESGRDSITVVINPLPTVVVSPLSWDICAGQNVTLSAMGAISYSWSPLSGLGSSTGPAVIAGPATTTTYTVTGTDAKGCTNFAVSTVTVHPLPTIVVPPVGICIGSDATLTATGASIYMWSPASSLSSNTGASVVASPSVTTTYAVIGTDTWGCVGSTSVTVMVSAIPPAPTVVSPVYYCQYAAAAPLTAAGSNLLWYTTVTGGTGSATAPVPPTGSLDTNTWYVSQTINGCEGPRDSITVIIRVNAETDFSYDIKYGCIYDTVQFTNNSKDAYRYVWDFGDNKKDTATNPVHYYRPVSDPTDFTVILYGYSRLCSDDSTMKIMTLQRTPPLELRNITPDQSIDYGKSITLNIEGADTYKWSPDNKTLSSLTIYNPVATPTDDITYIVWGTDERGCVDSASVRITIEYEDNPVLPTAFSPNGDGENDLARIINLKYNKLVGFHIFNRWGQVVFFTTDVNEGWDGTFNGTPQDLGVYVYLFNTTHPNGKGERSYKGNITLVR